MGAESGCGGRFGFPATNLDGVSWRCEAITAANAGMA